MSTNLEMRRYIDAVNRPLKPALDEGVIDNIKKWISGLNEPIKREGLKNARDLESKLKTRYGADVPAQVKSSNKDWVWSKITYKDLYDFSIKTLGTRPEDLDRVLKNKIVNNNLKQIVAALPPDIDVPPLPLTSAKIQNNTAPISPTIDKQTKQYNSKAVSLAILDGLAYLAQQQKDSAKPKPAASPDVTPSDTSRVAEPSGGSATGPAAQPTTPDEIKTAIDSIKLGLARMKGAA